VVPNIFLIEKVRIMLTVNKIIFLCYFDIVIQSLGLILSVYILMSFDFPFVKIVRSSVILLLPLLVNFWRLGLFLRY